MSILASLYFMGLFICVVIDNIILQCGIFINKSYYIIQQISNLTNIMARQALKAGSPTLFFIIKLLNIFFGICAIALIALGIVLWRQFQAFSIIEIVFIGLGFFEFLLVLMIWTAKTSVIKLRLFLFIMMILFVGQLTAVIITFAVGQKIIDKVIEDQTDKQEVEQMKKYLNIVTYYCVGTLVLMLLQMSFVYCYIGSLRNRNFQFDYKFLGEDGNKITIDQKMKYDKEKVAEKYNQKRQELYDKYPTYKEYKDKQQGYS